MFYGDFQFQLPKKKQRGDKEKSAIQREKIIQLRKEMQRKIKQNFTIQRENVINNLENI